MNKTISRAFHVLRYQARLVHHSRLLYQSTTVLNTRLFSKTTLSEPIVDPVTIDKRENITLIGLNRPECLNAVSAEMARQLKIIMRSFEDDYSSHVAILHGHGSSFCSGFDLEELASGKIDEQMKSLFLEHGPCGITHKPFKKPVIAALNGYVVGAGLEFALSCDMRIASKDTVLGVFNRKHGVPLIDGGTIRLPALIGLSRAMDLILTGRPVGAEEALQMGLVNKVVEKEDLTSESFEIAKQISKYPSFCMLTDRENAYRSVYNPKPFEQAIQREFENGWKVILMESINGAKKFVKSKKK